ncbi:hypothetical protein [Actinoallomurus acaciae]|uniref:Bulb-type lectin domain-containing protein n=1 Tax=Actinoallomurus acaciae TaxID=502577 RepID=A0ABV5YPF2_9ACTN
MDDTGPVRTPWTRAGPAGRSSRDRPGPEGPSSQIRGEKALGRWGRREDTAAARRPASPARTTAEAQTRVVHGTYVLRPGDEIRTNRLRLSLTSDGDLVLRDRNDAVVWSSGTHASGTHAVFQADGNFVVYGSDDQTLWSSRTDGHDGAVLVLQADGNLTITQGGTTLWATGTGG